MAWATGQKLLTRTKPAPARLPLQLYILYNFFYYIQLFVLRTNCNIFICQSGRPFLHTTNTPQPPKTLCPPQGASFRPLYGYKYSIFLWVTCSYRKECSLKTNKKRAFRLSPKAHLFCVGGVVRFSNRYADKALACSSI